MSLKDALDYAAYGWAVFPLLPNSKIPATQNGFHDASKEPEAIKTLWNNRTNYNLGIATGEVSGFWVLDIDAEKGGFKWLEEYENKYGSLPETLTTNTGGGGKHYLFKIPRDVKIGCTSDKIAKGVDTRGNGGYIVAPPSRHENGNLYDWANSNDIVDAPRPLLTIISNLRTTPKTKIIPAAPIDTDWTTEDVLSMLDFVDPDERETWIKVGMALKEGGWPLSIWDTWSRGSHKYKQGEPARKWSGFKDGAGISFGTLVHTAQENGWEPKEKPHMALDISNVNGVDLSEFKNNLVKKTEVSIVTKNEIEISGLISDTVAWINSCFSKPQPELAAIHTIGALGAIFGRRYSLQRLNTRTNMYIVGIAEPGQGKENSRICLSKLMRAAGLESFWGPEVIKSGAALMAELKMQPAFIANIDEFGAFMEMIGDDKANSYMKEISRLFLSLYSKSRSYYKDGITVTNPERTVLNEPHLCIFGTTTIHGYAKAMKKASINSGELSRFVVIKTPVDFPEANNRSYESDPPESLVSRWRQFAPTGWGAGAPDIIEQEKIIVICEDVEPELAELQKEQDEMQKQYHSSGLGNIWIRYRENTIKIAMILAIARNCKNPKLNKKDIETGKNITHSSLQFMIKFASNTMYDSGFQKNCGEFMAALEKGANTRTEMMNALKIKARDVDEIERALKEMGKIDYSEKERPKRYILK